MEINKQSDIYSFMIEQSGDIVFLLNKQSKFVFLNDRVKSLLGFKKQELLGRHFSLLIHPDDLIGADVNYPERRDLSRQELTQSIELRLRHKHGFGEYRYFDVKLLYVPDDIAEVCSPLVLGKENRNRRIMVYGITRDVTQLKLLDNIINANANSDCLTGLPNRVLLKDRMKLAIAQAKRDACKFAVMFFDLDGFKQVNDTYSHSAGDIVLQAIAGRLKTCLREVDTLARVGGDEFVLLLPSIHKLDEVRIIADKLLCEINKPFVINGKSMQLGASVGVTLYPDNGETFDELIKGADRAMYHIKHCDKNGYTFLSEISEASKQDNIFNFSLS